MFSAPRPDHTPFLFYLIYLFIYLLLLLLLFIYVFLFVFFFWGGGVILKEPQKNVGNFFRGALFFGGRGLTHVGPHKLPTS